MTKNLYYRSMLRRDNLLKKLILAIFQLITSYPRLLLEVFIRKDFGERYFQLSSALTITFILGLWPVIKVKVFNTMSFDETPAIFPHYLLWYLFLAAFLVFSFIRHAEIKRNPSVFDFAKFSLYGGTINPLFFKIQIPYLKTDTRLVETVYEPALFFIVGIILWLLHQNIGSVVVISSICYSLGYAADYYVGDNFVMDKIDEMIANEELEKSFVEGADGDQTRGFTMRAAVPPNIEMRRKMLPMMTEETDIIEAK